METILITVSVLSTLAIVAIVLFVVVIHQKLKGKVDVEVMNDIIKECDINNDELERGINKLEDAMYREIDERHREINNDVDDINRRIDSRHDKLHAHIGKEVENLYREINNNQKVLLKD